MHTPTWSPPLACDLLRGVDNLSQVADIFVKNMAKEEQKSMNSLALGFILTLIINRYFFLFIFFLL